MDGEEDPQMTTAEPMDSLGLEDSPEEPEQIEITDEMLEAMDPEERENLISQLIHSDQIPDTLRKPPSEVAIVMHHRQPPAPDSSLSRIFYKSGPIGPTFREPDRRKYKYKNFWFTKAMIESEESVELKIETNLSELVIFILFILVMCCITYGMLTPGMYYMTESLRRAFVETNFYQITGPEASFMDVRTPSDIFEYIRSIIVRYLYYENWYSSGDRTVVVPPDDKNILYENRLMGTARIHMVRVSFESCPIHSMFRNVFAACYYHFNAASETREPYIGESESLWLWKGGDKGTFPYVGKFATYSIGGYFQDLPYTSTEALKVIDTLKENTWITRSTRGVFIDFAVYNQNVNLFCIVKLIFEMPATGGVYPDARFTTSKLLRYVNRWDFFVLGCEMTFILFVFYNLLEEIREGIYFGVEYFLHLWHLVDFVILMVSLFCAAFIAYRAIDVPRQVSDMITTSEHHMNFTQLAAWQNFYNQCMTFVMFMCWCKLFKYLNFNKHMTIMPTTLNKCSLIVVNYAIVFMIMFLAFASMSHLMFGRNADDYSTLNEVLFTQLRVLIGNFDVEEITTLSSFGAAYFILYVLIISFICMNLFLSILNETYGSIRLEGVYNPKHITPAKFLLRGVINMCGCLRPKTAEIAYIAHADSNQIELIELYNALINCNFTESEVDIFMNKYHIDYHAECEPEEVTRLLRELQRKIFTPAKPVELLTSIEQHQVAIFTQEKSLRMIGPKTHGITIAEYEKMQSRLDQIEIQLEVNAERLTAALHALESAERNNWARKRQRK